MVRLIPRWFLSIPRFCGEFNFFDVQWEMEHFQEDRCASGFEILLELDAK